MICTVQLKKFNQLLGNMNSEKELDNIFCFKPSKYRTCILLQEQYRGASKNGNAESCKTCEYK